MLFGKDYDFSIVRTSSKEALLRSALQASNNDIKKASEICDYVIKMLPNLPEKDPIAPSTFEQVKDTALNIYNWGKDNQDQIIGAARFFMEWFGKSPKAAAPEVKPDVIFKDV